MEEEWMENRSGDGGRGRDPGKGGKVCFCMFCDIFQGKNAANNIAMAKQTDQEQLEVVTRLAWLNILNGKENGRDPQFNRY
jgi:hypothetical protein